MKCYYCKQGIVGEYWLFRQYKGQPKKRRPPVCSEKCLDKLENENGITALHRKVNGVNVQVYRNIR